MKDLTGSLRAWIDVGTPSAERLHRASKVAPRVAVYVHKEHTQWLAGLLAAKIHRADALVIRAIDRTLIGALIEALDRRMSFALAVADDELFVSLDGQTLSGAVTRLSL